MATEDTSQATALPNTETLEAIEAADRGETIGSFETVEDLMDALNDGFDEQILAELIAEGLSGEALMTAFRERKAQIRPAVEKLICEADAAAKGEGEYSTLEEVFGEEEDAL